jgi:hypothetical protein
VPQIVEECSITVVNRLRTESKVPPSHWFNLRIESAPLKFPLPPWRLRDGKFRSLRPWCNQEVALAAECGVFSRLIGNSDTNKILWRWGWLG